MELCTTAELKSAIKAFFIHKSDAQEKASGADPPRKLSAPPKLHTGQELFAIWRQPLGNLSEY
jgi:hypothetical protein